MGEVGETGEATSRPMKHKTAVVLVTFDGLDLLRSNLRSLHEQSLPFARIIIVDNGSTDGTRAFVREDQALDLLSLERNRGFAGGANAGIRRALQDASIDGIALVNNDVSLEPDWHEQAANALFSHPTFGSCATCLLKKAQPLQVDTAGICWACPGFADNYMTRQMAPSVDSLPWEVFGASAAAALYRRAFFENVGLFDESLFAYQEDVDLALRGRAAGWSCVFAPAARGIHQGFATNRPFPLGGTYADYYNARNRLYVLAKSLPREQWRNSWKTILATNARLLLGSFPEGRGFAVAIGMLHSCLRLPRALKARRNACAHPTRAAETKAEGARP